MNALHDDWLDIGLITDIPRQGARVIAAPGGNIAIFRTVEDEVFALADRCPHRGGAPVAGDRARPAGGLPVTRLEDPPRHRRSGSP